MAIMMRGNARMEDIRHMPKGWKEWTVNAPTLITTDIDALIA
jgi:hypothetical protein